METESMKYADDRDRSNGLAAMAVVLAVTEEEVPYEMVSLDSAVGEALMIDSGARLQSRGATEVVSAFRRQVRELQLSVRAAVANVVWRRQVSSCGPDYDTLRRVLREYAETVSVLESDEVREVVDEEFRLVGRVLNHPAVDGLVSRVAQSLEQRRSLSRREVAELLRR